MSKQYDFETIKSDCAYADALAKGCEVKIPAPNQLFIDIDDEDGSRWFSFNRSKIDAEIGITDEQWTPSQSGEPSHAHIVLTLAREVDDRERIFLQCLLGSDRQREALSWIRLLNNDPHPTLFFEKLPAQIAASTLA